MKFRRTPVLAGGLLLGLLALLAVLQLRWLDEMARSEGSRLRASASGRAIQLERDFDREIGRAYFWLQVATRSDPAAAWPEFAAAYDAWKRLAPHWKILGDVYLASAVDQDELRFSKFDPERGA